MYQNTKPTKQICQQTPVFNLFTIEQKQRKFYKSEPQLDDIAQALTTYHNLSSPKPVIPSKQCNVIIKDIDEGPFYSSLYFDEFSSKI